MKRRVSRLKKALNPEVRHDIVFLVEAVDSNPNGDPDNANSPRIDPIDNRGVITDVATKRRIRDSVAMRLQLPLYIANNSVLTEAHEAVVDEAEVKKALEAAGKDKNARAEIISGALLDKFWDIRIFGGTLSAVGKHAGRAIHGPMQVAYARSFSPIVPMEDAITRCARSNAKEDMLNQQFGRKTRVGYALYKGTASYCPARGAKVTEDDLRAFYLGLTHGWQDSASAGRSNVRTRGIYVWSHGDAYGDRPAWDIHEQIDMVLKDGVEFPTSWDSYEPEINEEGFEKITWESFK